MYLELDAMDADVIAEALQRMAVDLDAMSRLFGDAGLAMRHDKATRVAMLLRLLRPTSVGMAQAAAYHT
jgi:hypothetical protein